MAIFGSVTSVITIGDKMSRVLVTQNITTRLIDNELSKGGLLETNMVNPVSCPPRYSKQTPISRAGHGFVPTGLFAGICIRLSRQIKIQ